jgi:hypothetical protein
VKKDLPLCITSDSSNYAISCVLFQPQSLGQLPDPHNIVQIYSCSLKKHQKSWSIYRKEALALITALKVFHDWIYLNPVYSYVDNQALSRIMLNHENSFAFQWKEMLWRYNVHFTFIRSEQNLLADLLSRQTYHNIDEEEEEGPSPTNNGLHDVAVLSNFEDFVENHILPALPSENKVKVIESTMETNISESNNPEDYTEEFKLQLINEEHQLGHFSMPYLIKNLQRRGYRWKGMSKDILKFIRSCDRCMYENSYQSGYLPSQFYISSYPMETVQIDLLSGLPTNEQNFEHILVVLDICSDFCILRALRDKKKTTICQELISIFSCYGFAKRITFDNGKEFKNSLIDALAEYLKVELHFSIIYSPTSKGRIERKNYTIFLVLRKMVRTFEHQWSNEHQHQHCPLLSLCHIIIF